MLKVEEKKWNDYWAYYWRVTQLHNIPGIAEWDKKLVNFIEHVLDLSPGDRILDLACGGGDQSKLLAKKGYDILGIDIAPSLVDYARNQFKEQGLKGEFIVGDMTKFDYDGEFNAVLILSGSFGFFDDNTNQEVLERISKALKPGGKLFIMFQSAHTQVKHQHHWSECDNGWQMTETWFDAETCRRMSTVFIIKKDGTILKPASEKGYHAMEAIRCYSIPELQTMFKKAGLEYLDSYSDQAMKVPAPELKPDTPRNIITGRKK